MDWNRHLVKGPAIGAAALAAGLMLGVCACSPGSSTSQSSAAPAPPPTSASASSAAAVATGTASAAGTGGAGSVDANVVLDDCSNVAIVEPPTYTPTCADEGFVLNGIHWASWTAQQATGTAMATVKLCQPSCAAGGTGTYPVSFVFSGSATDPNDQNATTYITFTATYTGPQPPGAGPSQTFQVGPNG
jgi:hypothetical protein